MVKGIVIDEHGGPEVMRWNNVNLEKIGPNDVLIEQSVVGLNFIDIYSRCTLERLTKRIARVKLG